MASEVPQVRQVTWVADRVPYQDRSEWRGEDYLTFQEWSYKTNKIVIYRELTLKGEDGVIKRHEVYGPFAVELKRGR